MKHSWTQTEINFLIANYPSNGCLFCANTLNLSLPSITHKAIRLGLKITKERKSEIQRLRASIYRPEQCNVDSHQFINCKTPEAAYILGFIWADGYLQNKNCNKYRISIEIAHADWLDLYEIFNKTGKWAEAHRHRPNKQKQSSFITSNKELFEFLQNLGYKSKSNLSADSILEKISENLRHYWFRGYFDGDGCFYANKQHRCHQFSVCSSYDQDWNFIVSLYNKLELNFKIMQRKQKNSSHSVVRSSSKKDIRKFGEYIYSGVQFGLKRKLDKYLEIIS